MVNKKFLLIILGFSVLMIFSGCGLGISAPVPTPTAYNITPGLTPAVKNFGRYQTKKPQAFPRHLDCSVITELKLGGEWGGIQIGKSTFDEVGNYLGKHGVWWNGTYGHLDYSEGGPEKDWYSLDACYIGNILSAIRTSAWDKLPRELEAIIEQNGYPDRTTWGDEYRTRSLIWAELGMLVVVEVEYEERTHFILFPPLPKEELETSWLMLNLPQEGEEYVEPENNIDVMRMLLENEVEDPWGFNQREQ